MGNKRQMVLSPTGQTVVCADPADILLDKHVKKLLACKPILACILQETVEECRGMTAEEVEKCIEGTPQVEQVPVLPNTDTPEYDLPLRALFYCCRMVSSQLGTEFSNQPDDADAKSSVGQNIGQKRKIKGAYRLRNCSNERDRNGGDKYVHIYNIKLPTQIL